MTAPGARMAIQMAGRGRLESHPPGNADNARFEGRFVIYALNGKQGPVFGEDVSLHDADIVAKHGRGPQSAHLVAIRSGWVLESFDTSDDHLVGHMIGRSSAETRLRVFFNPSPDGSRAFGDRGSFMKGELVATYQAEEYFHINPTAGVFDTRVNYTLLESTPFTFRGVTVDFADIAPQMVELSHGHNPAPDPNPEPVPMEEPFLRQGDGVFAEHFTVGGTMFVAD